MTDTPDHRGEADRVQAHANYLASLRASKEYQAFLHADNGPAGWNGLPLSEQSLTQLQGNLADQQQQLTTYYATYGNPSNPRNDAFLDASPAGQQLHQRIADIEAEIARRWAPPAAASAT